MSTTDSALRSVMQRAVDACSDHVNAGGLPFVGVLVNADGEMVSDFGVNRVAETRDPMAHAEIVAMREAMRRLDRDSLAGAVLLATGEPCGLCYKYAIDHGIEQIYVAIDRDEVARYGFDYLASYPMFGITDSQRTELFRPMPTPRGIEPFIRYLHLHTPGQTTPARTPQSKGTSS